MVECLVSSSIWNEIVYICIKDELYASVMLEVYGSNINGNRMYLTFMCQSNNTFYECNRTCIFICKIVE